MSTFPDDLRYPLTAQGQPGDSVYDPVTKVGPRYFVAPSVNATEVTHQVANLIPARSCSSTPGNFSGRKA